MGVRPPGADERLDIRVGGPAASRMPYVARSFGSPAGSESSVALRPVLADGLPLSGRRDLAPLIGPPMSALDRVGHSYEVRCFGLQLPAAILGRPAGRGAAWQRACFGSRRSPVRIRPPRLRSSHDRGHGSERRHRRARGPRARRAAALPLRLVVRDAARAPDLGAEVAVAEYRDGAAMRAAFDGRGDRLPRVGLRVRRPGGRALQRRRRRRGGRRAADRLRVVHGRRARLRVHVRARPRRDGGADPLDRARRTSSCARACTRSTCPCSRRRGRDPRAGGRRAGRVRLARRHRRRRGRGARRPGRRTTGRTYDVTGPEALSLDEAAAILSEAAGRAIVYERETLEQARESRRPSGAPGLGDRGLGDLLRGARRAATSSRQRHRRADPRPPAALARRRPARAPRERLAHLRR